MAQDTAQETSDLNQDDDFTPLDKLLLEQDKDDGDLVKGALSLSTLGMLSGDPDAGKTVFAQNLALAVAQGEPFLGRETKQGKVLYLALEGPRKRIRKKFTLMGARTKSILVMTGSVPCNPGGEFDWLKQKLEKHSPVLVIIDLFGEFIDVQDLNDYNEMICVMSRLAKLASDYKCFILCLHHTPKPTQQGGKRTGPLGSRAILGRVDVALEIRVKGKSLERFLYTLKNKDGDYLNGVPLNLDPKTNRFIFEGRGLAFEKQNTTQPLAPIQKKTLSKIKVSEELTLSQIANKIPVKSSKKIPTAKEWIKAGLFTPISGNVSDIFCRGMKYKKAYRYC